MTRRTWIAPLVATFLLAWAGLTLAQNSSGGAFLPGFDYVVSGQWTWRRVSPFVIEGATDNASETTVTFTEPTADRTVTFPDATGTVVLANAATSGAVEAGITSLDGSNPTSVTTNLSALAGCTVQQHTATAPGITILTFTTLTTAVAGRLDIYAWAATSSSNPTLIASVSQDTVRYVCVGTR